MSDSNKFRSLRLSRAWSQEQLAELSGLSVRTVQRIENGDQPSLETLSALAAVFEVSVGDLSGPDSLGDDALDQRIAEANGTTCFLPRLAAWPTPHDRTVNCAPVHRYRES